MRYILISILLSFFFLFGYSCKNKSDNSKNIFPSSIDFGGIKFSQSKDELVQLHPNIRCYTSKIKIDTCLWVLPKSAKNGIFRSVRQIYFQFEDQKLKMFRCEYDQMFDVEYNFLQKDLRQAYSPAVEDTLNNIWQYDSIRITLASNVRKHWTGRFMIYSPVIEFQTNL